VICLIAGFLVPGWLLLRLGLGKAFRNWAQSLEYRLNQNSLSVSSCFALWGLVLSRHEKHIPLAKITDVRLVQGPVLNTMDLWALQIQTASSGYQWPEAVLYALENPHEARDQILQAIARIHASHQ
jgi:membrane protein YdbS with pleckstrin-like domain